MSNFNARGSGDGGRNFQQRSISAATLRDRRPGRIDLELKNPGEAHYAMKRSNAAIQRPPQLAPPAAPGQDNWLLENWPKPGEKPPSLNRQGKPNGSSMSTSRLQAAKSASLLPNRREDAPPSLLDDVFDFSAIALPFVGGGVDQSHSVLGQRQNCYSGYAPMPHDVERRPKSSMERRKYKRFLHDVSNIPRELRIPDKSIQKLVGSPDALTPIEKQIFPEVDRHDLSRIERLPFKILDCIVQFISLRERLTKVAGVSRRFYNSVRRSVTAVAFFGDGLDTLSDTQIKALLMTHQLNIRAVNFDLFRTTSFKEVSQWDWRKSIFATTQICQGLTSLTALVCTRHRFRDEDLLIIFKHCPALNTLRIDAQFISGRCFMECAASDAHPKHMELDMCYRMKSDAMMAICDRFRLKTFYASQMLCLDDRIISRMARVLTSLTELSIISHPQAVYPNLTASGLMKLAQMKLEILCLEGLGPVTDRVLAAISDPATSVAARRLHSLSFAFCYNVSTAGVAALHRLPALKNLNFNGVSKRDIGEGLKALVGHPKLTRLLLAENANVAPEILLAIVEHTPNLRYVDIVNNETILNFCVANGIIRFWEKSGKPPLTILTSNQLIWDSVGGAKVDEHGRKLVRIIHVDRENLDPSTISSTTALEPYGPRHLEAGYLAPQIRKGDRYRYLWQSLGPDEKPANSIPEAFDLKAAESTEAAAEQAVEDAMTEEQSQTTRVDLGRRSISMTTMGHSIASGSSSSQLASPGMQTMNDIGLWDPTTTLLPAAEAPMLPNLTNYYPLVDPNRIAESHGMQWNPEDPTMTKEMCEFLFASGAFFPPLAPAAVPASSTASFLDPTTLSFLSAFAAFGPPDPTFNGNNNTTNTTSDFFF